MSKSLPHTDAVSTALSDSVRSSSSLTSKLINDFISCVICKKTFNSTPDMISHMFLEHKTQTNRPVIETQVEPETRDSSTPLGT